jgi:anti-anti-sigma factor
VLLDLDKLRYCGSSLLAVFLRITKAVCQNGGKWAICNVTSTVADVFRRTQLDTIWPIYASREDAYATLRTDG